MGVYSLGWLLLLGLAFAQEARPVAAISDARREVVVVASYLRDKAVAEALRQAITQGVRVELVTSPYTYLDGSSYFLSLYLAGARVWLGYPSDYLLFVDGSRVYRGKGLTQAGGGLVEVSAEELPAMEAKLRQAKQVGQPLLASPSQIVQYLIKDRR